MRAIPCPGDYIVTLNAAGREYKQTAKFLSRAPEDSPEEGDSNPGLPG